jgi:hypothetical protein
VFCWKYLNVCLEIWKSSKIQRICLGILVGSIEPKLNSYIKHFHQKAIFSVESCRVDGRVSQQMVSSVVVPFLSWGMFEELNEYLVKQLSKICPIWDERPAKKNLDYLTIHTSIWRALKNSPKNICQELPGNISDFQEKFED